MSVPNRRTYGMAVHATATSERALPATSRNNAPACTTAAADMGTDRRVMTGVIALVRAADRYPMWRRPNGPNTRAIVDAERPAAPIPIEHATLTAEGRPLQVRARLARMRGARVSGQGMSSAAVFADRLLARERIAQLHERADDFAVADISRSVDGEYPRTLIDAAYEHDPVHRDAPAAAGIALQPVPAQPVRVAGRIAIPARGGHLSRADLLPERFTGPGAHTVLAEPGGTLLNGRYAAVHHTAAATLADLREQLEGFADWAEDALGFAASSRSAA